MEYCAKSELHPASAGLGMLKGRPAGYLDSGRLGRRQSPSDPGLTPGPWTLPKTCSGAPSGRISIGGHTQGQSPGQPRAKALGYSV